MKRGARPLRSGYTTGACAAAAAKGAVMMLLGLGAGEVEIPFPDGGKVLFRLHECELKNESATASVIKDAGDDPDVTNGALILAEARFIPGVKGGVLIRGGKGVGMVTRPGLAVPSGGPAINPVPRRMITEAASEILDKAGKMKGGIEITISVPEGERLAKKTLNARLGIIGGLSILGTTGIVRPLSKEAWTATITASMDVARALGLEEAVLSSGRTSELAHMREFGLAETAYVMSGDFVEFSLVEAKRHGFKRLHLCAQWAKMLKIAMRTPDTNVRAGVIDLKKAVRFLEAMGLALPARKYNTAREIFDFVPKKGAWLERVCTEAGVYGQGVSGIPVNAYLISYEGKIIARSGW
ncbi:MAG: cobalt-precorrin-5B (C(1))-methyltransferase CbiD [Nitrospiraceae bacterium]|nr:cobalt-precorrin-5B (C(1))-methyltransferase CbiD [Nitrospiraceae bacterium]